MFLHCMHVYHYCGLICLNSFLYICQSYFYEKILAQWSSHFLALAVLLVLVQVEMSKFCINMALSCMTIMSSSLAAIQVCMSMCDI